MAELARPPEETTRDKRVPEPVGTMHLIAVSFHDNTDVTAMEPMLTEPEKPKFCPLRVSTAPPEASAEGRPL